MQKKRNITLLLLTATVAVGLTGCSGSSAPAETNSSETANSSAAEQQGAEQTVAEACLELAEPLSKASTAMAEIASAGSTDPQAAVASWTELVDAFGTFSESTTNSEVKAAATAAHTDLTAVRDSMQKVYVDGDMGALNEFTSATTNMQTSYSAVLTLCSS